MEQNRNRRMKQLFLFVFIISIYSCGKDDTSTNCSSLPLAVGNTWNYNITYYNANGNQDSVRTLTVVLNKTSNYNGKSYYVVDSFFYNPIRSKDCNTLALYDPTTNTEFDLANSSTKNDNEIYNLRYGTSSVECRGIRILNNKDRVTVNNYNCYKFEYQYTSCSGVYYRKRIYYVDEKVGMVRSEGYNIVSGTARLTDREDLTTYTLK